LGRGKNGKGSLGKRAVRVQFGNETHIDGKTLQDYHALLLGAPPAILKLLIIKNKMKMLW
jgi:hypothetical protein